MNHWARIRQWRFVFRDMVCPTLEVFVAKIGREGKREREKIVSFFFSFPRNEFPCTIKNDWQSIEVIERSNKKRNEKWSNGAGDKNSIRCINIIAMIFIRRLQIIFRVYFRRSHMKYAGQIKSNNSSRITRRYLQTIITV